ncbi:MAG TPA: glucose 1-dehydrogenase [Acidimicrobiales bacterium]|nr:glucose 1-dehydrogenase [Acidimicrobiales bacterium]
MRALAVVPGTAGSAAIADLPEPDPREGAVLVETLSVGVCGTDEEIVAGEYGSPPAGDDHLVLGHESLGRVLEAPPGAGVRPGDLVVGIVRRPDPVPCYACAAGEWDACRNGRYREHGIKELHGFLRERYRAEPDALVRVAPELGRLGVLLEPTTIVAKAWQQIDAAGRRSSWHPRRVLVVGAGPIGLLAALLAVQRSLEVHVVDRVAGGLKPELVARLGAAYHEGPLAEACEEPDVVLECTGLPDLVFEAIEVTGNGGVTCLTGIGPPSQRVELDGGRLGRSLVLENRLVLGSVNANRTHYEAGAAALAAADLAWLERLVTRRVPLGSFGDALARRDEDVKVVIDLAPLPEASR